MVVLRCIAWVLFLLAIIALVGDLTRAANGGSAAMTTVFGYWKTVSPQSVAEAAAFVRRHLHTFFWDQVAMRVLLLPLWLMIAAIGLTCAVLGRKKRRVNIFAN